MSPAKVVSELVIGAKQDDWSTKHDPVDLEAAAKAVIKAGGTVLRQGEFYPGERYLFFPDPDGYEVEIWFEWPTPVDPKR